MATTYAHAADPHGEYSGGGDLALEIDPLYATEEDPLVRRPKRSALKPPPPLEFGAPEEYSAQMMNAARLCFIRRVYGILTAQLLATVAVSMACMFIEPLRTFCFANANVWVWATMIPMFVSLLALYKYKSTYPANYALLSTFTLCQSGLLGLLCALYYVAGAGVVLLQALVLTLSVFGGLTAYTFVTRTDFSFMGAALSAGLWVVIGWSLLSAIIGFQTGLLFSLLGTLLFCGFILYDTANIIDKYSYDDYIVAAIELYLDIINLFLFILELLAKRR